MSRNERVVAEPTTPPASTSHCARVMRQARGLKSLPMTGFDDGRKTHAEIPRDRLQQLDIDAGRRRIAGDQRRIGWRQAHPQRTGRTHLAAATVSGGSR